MKLHSEGNNLSVLYLALICLLYYILASGMASPYPPALHGQDTIYIEVDHDNTSFIYVINNITDLDVLSDIYNIDIIDGDKIILAHDGETRSGRISGIKSLSLGVPIGINSASKQDLIALPGIGEVTAERIVEHRENSGGYGKLEELDNVPGIGEKTLQSLNGKISLD